MVSAPSPEPDPASPTRRSIAQDVARGVTGMFFNQDVFALCEVPLPNGRRADMMAIDAGGTISIVEIKVSRADLLGDRKWIDYLDYCDRFFWAVPAGFDLGPFEAELLPARPVRPARRRPLRRGGDQGALPPQARPGAPQGRTLHSPQHTARHCGIWIRSSSSG